MQNGARYQAVLEILTQVFQDEVPADKIVSDYLRARKYIGAKDRRFITDWVWKIIRNRMKLSFDACSDDPRRVLLYALRDRLDEVFDDSTYGMSPLMTQERNWLSHENENVYPEYVEAECPKWLFDKINDARLCHALNAEAFTDIRAHGVSREELQRKLSAEGIETFLGGYAPKCLRLHQRLVLNNCMAWQDGLLDVQDESSQIAALMIDAKPEHKIMDYCCGAGGKALALSDLLQNQGHILAYDVDAKRLEAIQPRLQRLKVKNIELTDIVADSDKDFDRFVLDAPCSGTGTWRRAPDAKFRLNEKRLEKLCRTQAELLDIAAVKTKLGGRIVYMTCSVLRDENEAQIEAFLSRNAHFVPLNLRVLWKQKMLPPYPCRSEIFLRLSPVTTETDGFFICVLEKQN